ncbi:hypothetical protein ACIRP2_21140 [Streptomyces sp. NPDC101194]
MSTRRGHHGTASIVVTPDGQVDVGSGPRPVVLVDGHEGDVEGVRLTA